jgi:hypothetical protein
MMKKMMLLMSLILSAPSFAGDGKVFSIEKTSYGAKIILDFDRDYAGGDLITIINVAHWNQTVACTQQNGELVANVDLDRKLLFNNCKPGKPCQIGPQIASKRSFKIRIAELCEQGAPTKVFVNGTQVL